MLAESDDFHSHVLIGSAEVYHADPNGRYRRPWPFCIPIIADPSMSLLDKQTGGRETRTLRDVAARKLELSVSCLMVNSETGIWDF